MAAGPEATVTRSADAAMSKAAALLEETREVGDPAALLAILSC